MSIRNSCRTCQWLSWVHDLLDYKHLNFDEELNQVAVRIYCERTVSDGVELRVTILAAVARIVARGSTDRVNACFPRSKYDRVLQRPSMGL